MENIQQKTDYQILRQYISNYPGASTYFTPDLMIRDALRYMNHIRSLHELIHPTQQFQLLYEYTRHVTSPVIVEEPTIDLFCITLYILLRADGVETQNEKDSYNHRCNRRPRAGICSCGFKGKTSRGMGNCQKC